MNHFHLLNIGYQFHSLKSYAYAALEHIAARKLLGNVAGPGARWSITPGAGARLAEL